MISHFKKFEGAADGKHKEKDRVTFSPRRFFGLNAFAYRTIGRPEAVELYFDEHQRKIGMMPCDPRNRNAFRIRKEKGKEYYVIYAAAFCRHFALSTRRTVLFDQPATTPDGMLVLDMNKAINVGRAGEARG